MQEDFETRYHGVENEHWWFVGRRHLLGELIRNLEPDYSCRILDVGCSAGATIRSLRDQGFTRLTGIDVSHEAIARCRSFGLQDVHVMDAQQPDFPDGSFDIIIASDVLEHVDDESATVQAWYRLLRPRGIVIALVPAFMALWSPHDEANQHRKRYRLAELRGCLEKSGFSTQRASYWNFLLLLPAAVARFLQRAFSKTGAGQVDLDVPPAPVNTLLSLLLRCENRLLLAGLDWPWGLSALVIARRPGAGNEHEQHA